MDTDVGVSKHKGSKHGRCTLDGQVRNVELPAALFGLIFRHA